MFDSNESSLISDQMQSLTNVTELAAAKTFETAFSVQSRAPNLKDEWL
jgi:hypothetical protein